jgi:hypothetical protein
MCNHTAVAKLPIRRPGNLKSGRLRMSSFYVFWLLLFLIWFGTPLVAQQSVNVEDGAICLNPGQVVTLQNNNPDNGTVISISCVCTKNSDDNSASWHCDED